MGCEQRAGAALGDIGVFAFTILLCVLTDLNRLKNPTVPFFDVPFQVGHIVFLVCFGLSSQDQIVRDHLESI